MRSSFRYSLVLSFILAGVSAAPAQSSLAAGEQTGLKLTVRVYNYAQASSSTLVRAKHECEKIFRAVRVETEWRDCPTSAGQNQANLECRQPLGPAEVVLRLMPRSASAKGALRDTAFGYADGGILASVFYYHIEDLAKGYDDNPSEIPVILGYAMSHEIGHLLLGSNSHSPTGIMCGNWDRRLVQKALWNRLQFTPAQAEMMRAEILSRGNQKEVFRSQQLRDQN